MTRTVTRSRAALRDLLDHFDYLSDSSPEAAERFIDCTNETVTLLSQFPHIGREWIASSPRLSGVRVWPIRGFENFPVFYKTSSRGLTILRVLHAARDINTLL